jgi:O-antigen ligase
VTAAAPPSDARRIDRALEIGLAAVLVLAPLPFGAVTAAGRLSLEVASFVLLLIWARAGWSGPLELPPRRVLALLGGLLLLAASQSMPLGERLIGVLSPRSNEVRASVAPDEAARVAEEVLLQSAPADFDPAPTLSVEPGATASALRTGVALCALLIVATHVAARRGLGGLAAVLLFSAAMQAMYGLIVLASGYDRIWNVEKTAYLDSATGTWINRNHFADYLAMALPLGAALWVRGHRREGPRTGSWLLRTFSSAGSRNLLRLLALLIGMAGLLVSFSRAGIAIGLGCIAATLWLGTRYKPPAMRVIIVVLAIAVALIPLAQLGADALWQRFERSADDFASPGSRGTVWRDTVDLARAFPLLGSGFGTFAAVYPKFRSPEVRFFFSYAHNDLLQFAAEGGLVGLLLLLGLLASLRVRLFAALRGEYGVLAIGAAAGLAAALLHSLIDFNFHLPANAAVAAVLAGALWGTRSEPAT